MHLDSNRRGQKNRGLWGYTNHILDPARLNTYFADALPAHKKIIVLTRRPSFLHQGGFWIGSLPLNKGTRNPTSTASPWIIFSWIHWNWCFHKEIQQPPSGWEASVRSLITFHSSRWAQVPQHFSRTSETSYTHIYTSQSHHMGPAHCIYYQGSYFKNWRWQMSMFCSSLQDKNYPPPPQ